MSNYTVVVIDKGIAVPLPDGGTPIDAGGHLITGASPDYQNLDCSGNPNYPTGNKGTHVIISVAGKIGGASGVTVEAGDIAICTADSTASGDQAGVGTYWVVVNKNIADSAAAIRKRYAFVQDIILDGQNNLTNALVMDICSAFAGYLVGSSIKMQTARTGGTISISPHINGTALTPTDLNLSIGVSPTTKDNHVVAYGTSNYSVTAGDTIGFIASTSSFTPLANRATLTLIIEG